MGRSGLTAETPEVPGIVSVEDLATTAKSIVALQLPSGMIQWFPGGHTDPWNHIEAAMALATCGFVDEAEAAYHWLLDRQRPDGSWHNYYLADEVEDPKLDTNCVAYIATGIYHHSLRTGSVALAERAWPRVVAAIEFVLSMQTDRGEVVWAREVDDKPWTFALLSGSSSISHSLGCGVKLAELLGDPKPRWAQARQRLVDVIANHQQVFEPKDRWAMDWYYPVLTGAVPAAVGAERLLARWDTFVMEGHGVRCVHDEPWVTAAETAECVIACLAAGLEQQALNLYRWVQDLRDTDGAYYTGMVHPGRITYPDAERSAYSAAAIVLAADALNGQSATSGLFLPHRPAPRT